LSQKIHLSFFLDDILAFSKDLESHEQHLRITLELLRKNKLFARMSKCKFGCEEVEYLGYVIFASRVKADYGKIKAMVEWPFPKTLKSLRGFLGLTGCYRKFIKGYGSFARPFDSYVKEKFFFLGGISC
jgi:hypothetical protein